MAASWEDLEIPDADFDIAALSAALESRRLERGLSWTALAREIGRTHGRDGPHPISPSTLSGLRKKHWGIEGDGVLQMLLWLDRSPESFVPGHPGATHPDARLPQAPAGKILRFDVSAIFARIEARREVLRLTWTQAAEDVGRFYNAGMLQNMRKQRRTAFPQVMRLARWLRCPAAALTRVADF